MRRAPTISLVLIAPLIAVVAWSLRAAEPDAKKASNTLSAPAETLRFRRVFVPADRPEDWPTSGQRYLPLDTAEFTRLLELAQAAELAAPTVLAARIERAQYEARLVGDDLLVGRATLDVTHSASEPALLPLSPWSMAVTSAHWEIAKEPAKVGNLPGGIFSVIADRSGKLVVEWELRGERQAGGGVAFPLNLPKAALGELLLEAPLGIQPELEQAIVSEAPVADKNVARWKIELGGRGGGTLRLAGTQSTNGRRNLTLLRQANTYTFTSRGLDLASELQLQVNGNPLTALTLQLDPGLQLVAARSDGQDLAWSVSVNDKTGAITARVETAKAFAGSSSIQLAAVATLGIGKLEQLPRIRPDGLVWQEESSKLVARSPYVIERLVVHEGRQTTSAASSSEPLQESVGVQSFSPHTTIEVRVDYPVDRIAVEHCTRVEFLSSELIANCVAEFKIRQGTRAEFVCDVGALWQIDSVEVNEPFAIVDWDVEAADPHRKLVVRVAPAVAANQSVRLSIVGRRNLVLRESMDLDNLRMLRFPELNEVRKFLVLRQPETLELQTAGLERISRIDPASFAANDPLRMATASKDIAFVIDAAATPLAITLVPRKPKFDAEIRIDAQVSEKSVTELCRLHCEPSGVAMERLLVHFSGTEAGTWQWSTSAAIGPLTVRRLSAKEQVAAGAGGGGHAFELRWTNPQRTSFELRATRSSPFTVPFGVTLADLPDAAEQTGLVAVRVADDSAVTITNHQLPELPTEVDTADPPHSARGLFRYTPARDGLGAEPPLELFSAPVAQEESGAFVWACELDTRLGESGVASHTAVLRLQTGGQSKVRISWPVGATPRGAWIDTQRIRDASVQNSADGLLMLDLPQGKTFVTVTLDYVTNEALPRFIGSYQPPFVATNIPVLARRWRLWLPNKYDLSAIDPRAHRYCAVQPTWSQRLFGPLGREATSSSANPLSTAFWTLDGVARSERMAANREALSILNALGAAVSSKDRASAGPLSWGQLFAAIGSVEGPEIRIDAKALGELGITAATRVANIKELDATLPGQDLLRRSHLVLLVRPDHVLISTNVIAALHWRSVQPLQNSVAYYVLPGALDSDLTAAPDTRQPLGFLTPSAWQAAAQLSAPNWTVPENIREILADNGIRKVYQFDLSDKSSVKVAVQNQAAVVSVAGGLALLIVALGLSFGWARRPAWPIVVAIAFAVAMLVPIVWSPLFAAVFMSALFAWLWSLWRPVVGKRLLSGDAKPVSTSMHRLATATTIVACIFAAYANRAKAIDASATAETSEPIKVFVPIDDDQHPSGDKVFVPDALYRELGHRAELARKQPRDWIFTKARYRMALAREASRGDVAPTVRASFDLLVFDRKQTVRFALGGGRSKVLVDTAQLDGQPTTMESRANGEWSVSIEESGVHRFEVMVIPTLQRFGPTIGFDAIVPPVASAELEIADTDNTDVELPTALGSIVTDKDHNRVLARLGAATRLAVRWPKESAAERAVPIFELDELLWAKLQPGSTTIEARLNVRVIEGRLRRLQLVVDPRLRLVSPVGVGSQIASVHSSPLSPQAIEVELAVPIVEQGVVDLKFSVAEASGIGNLQLPRCEVSGVRAARRWLALWVDPALEFREEVGEDLQAVAVPEFLATWGVAEVQPQTAFRIPRGDVAWAISARPRPPLVAVEQDTLCEIEPSNANIRWQAKVNVTAGEVFQLDIKVPSELTIDSIAVRDEDAAASLRWTRDQNGLVTLMFNQPLIGTRFIALEGRMVHPTTGEFAVPSIQLESTELNRSAMYVCRHPLVLVEARPEADWQPPASLTTEMKPSANQSLVAAFDWQKHLGQVRVKVTPNRPVTTATEIVTVDRDGDNWVADLALTLQVQEGIVDSLLFDIPPEWTELVNVDQPDALPVSLSVLNVPGETARRLLVIPSEPIHDHWRLVVRGKLAPTTGDRLRISDIEPKGLTKVDRFLLLPTQVELQSVAWETSRLVEAELPADTQPGLVVPESHTIYRVLEGRAQALLRTNESGGDQAQVTLAVIQFAWEWDGRVHGVATFDLEPAGTTDFVLRMPASFSPIHLALGTVPGRLVPIEPGRWRLRLDSSLAPRHIELVFLGDVPKADFLRSDGHIERPALEHIATAQTVWSMVAPSQARSETAFTEQGVESPARFALGKMKSSAALGDIAFDLSANQPTGMAPRWFRPWWDRFTKAETEFEVIRLAGQDQDSVITEVATEARTLSKRRPHGEARNRNATAESLEETSAAAVWTQEIGVGRPLWYRAPSPGNSLPYNFSSRPAEDTNVRLLVGLAAILVGATITFRSRRHSVSTTTLGVVVGAIWWAMLQPTWVGPMLIFVSLLAKTRWLPVIADVSAQVRSNASNS
jgi:hypothetical protein